MPDPLGARSTVLRPSRKALAMGFLGWPVPLAPPALVVLVVALVNADWLLAALGASCVVLVVWRVLQVKLVVGPESLTVVNPWRRTQVAVRSSTRIDSDATVSFAPVATLGLGVFDGAEHVVGIVASSYPSATSLMSWVPELQALSARTGCTVEVPETWAPRPWWR